MPITRRKLLTYAAALAGAWAVAPAAGGAARRVSPKASEAVSPVSLLHFSPAGATLALASRLAGSLSSRIRSYDLTAQNLKPYDFSADALLMAAVPVYGGRVPARAAEALRLCRGEDTPAVSFTAFGGRAFDDALLELNDLLAGQGFRVFASGAFTARHFMVEEFGADRPDAGDLARLDAFAAAVRAKLASGRLTAPLVPGNRPYKEVKPSAITPLTSEACITCGLCARGCPATAIPYDAPATTLPERCFTCMRCVANCPVRARALPPQVRAAVADMLRKASPQPSPNAAFL